LLNGLLQGRLAPAGLHHVKLDGVEEMKNDIGLAYGWTWRVVDGEHAGCIIRATTGRELVGGSALGDLLDAMYGRKLQEGDAVDLAYLMSRKYELVARPSGRNSGGAFQSVRPIQEG
jgi:hypothetical protein